MSTTSGDLKKLLKGSEGESSINIKAVGGVAVGLVLLWLFTSMLNGIGSGALPFGLSAQREQPVPTVPSSIPTQAVIALATDEATATAWPTPIIITNEKIIEVPFEVTREVAIYYEIPIEVTRIVSVEVPNVPLPTITPIPLAPGTIQVCASVEGAKALYIGNEGVVSGGCKTYTFGMGQTTILVQVDR